MLQVTYRSNHSTRRSASTTLVRRLLGAATAVLAAASGLSVLAPAASADVVGTRPWVVVLCKFTDTQEEPHSVDYYRRKFTEAGAGQGGMFDYWRDVSYGKLDVTGTVVKGWYTLPMTLPQYNGLDRDDRIRACASAAVNDVDYSKYQGVIAIGNHDVNPAKSATTTLTSAIDDTATTLVVGSSAGFPPVPFPAFVDGGEGREQVNVTQISGDQWTVVRGWGGYDTHPHGAGTKISQPAEADFGAACCGLPGAYPNLYLVDLQPGQGLTGVAHEMGHGFGMNHSRRASTKNTDYGDCWDVMSAYGCVYRFDGGFQDGPNFTGAGPGLNAIQLEKQGWLPDRKYTLDNTRACRADTFTLAALNHPEAQGVMMAKIPVTSTDPAGVQYSLEFRSKTGWDRAIPTDAVVVHLLGTDGVSYLVDSIGSPGRPGSLVAGEKFADAAQKAFVAVHSIDSARFNAVVTVGSCPIPTDLRYVGDVAGDVTDKVDLAAELRAGGGSPGPVISGADLTLGVGPQTCQATTDPTGRARCSVTLNQDPGTRTVTATYAGSNVYAPTTVSQAFTVDKESTRLTYSGDTTAQYDDTVRLSAVLDDPGTTVRPVDGRTIAFTLGRDQTCSATTDATGAASCTVTAAQPAGELTVKAAFAGDARYNPSTAERPFVLERVPTAILMPGDVTGVVDEPVTLRARLADARNDQSLPGAPVTFVVGGSEACSAATDDQGVATCTSTRPEGAGTYPVVAGFAGTVKYEPSSTTVRLTLDRVASKVVYEGATSGMQGQPARVAGRVTDARIGQPLPGERLVFTLDGGETCAATTGGDGTASCEVIPRDGRGDRVVTVAYGGSRRFLPSTSTGTFYVIVPTETGRATAVRLRVPLLPEQAVADTGEIRTDTTSSTERALVDVPGPLVTGSVAEASVRTTFNRSDASASMATVSVAAPGLPVIVIGGVRAQSSSTCSESSGFSEVSFLSVGGQVLVGSRLHAAPNSVLTAGGGLLSPIVRVVLNEQVVSPAVDGGEMTVNAVHVTVAGLVDLVVSSARSGIHDCVPPGP